MTPNRPMPRGAATERATGGAACGTEPRTAHAASGGAAALEERIAGIAVRQYGLITRAQLLSLGVSSAAVKSRVRTKRLRPVQRGIYRVGPLVPRRAREMAAVLACGPGAVLSHSSAAVLWRLIPSNAIAPVELTVAGRDRRRRPGMKVHRTDRFPPDELATVAGIPATAAGRTVLDLAGELDLRQLEQALARAERQRLTNRQELLALAARHPNHRGARRLRTMLERTGGPALTRSEAEKRFLALVRKAQLPPPRVNVRAEGCEVDFLWPAQGLVVEVDGFAFHSSAASFERDRKRDMKLSAAGLHVVRVTWRQIVKEPEATLVRLAQTLARSAVRVSRQVSRQVGE